MTNTPFDASPERLRREASALRLAHPQDLASGLYADIFDALATQRMADEARIAGLEYALERIRDGKPNAFNTRTAHDHYAATSAIAATHPDQGGSEAAAAELNAARDAMLRELNP